MSTMGTKTISLADDAYQALLAMKKPDESFSDTVRRLARRRSLTELAGIMRPEDAKAVARAIEKNREDRMKVRRKELGL
jgi:predicted CopG family antitoxin